MDEDEIYEDEAEPAYVGGRRFHPLSLLLIGVQVVEESVEAVRSGLGDVKMTIGMHINYTLDRERFAAEAGRELEKILEGNDGGDARGL